MNSRDFYASGIKSTTSAFPKANEQQSKPKLKVPDLSTELYKDQKMFYKFDTSLYPPPLSTTSCFIQETTNTDVNLLRSTMYVLPSNTPIFENLNIPFGILLTPFSFKSDSKRILKRKEAVICNQCGGYANNRSKIFSDHWMCNLCNAKNTFFVRIDTKTSVISKGDFNFDCKYPTMEFYSEIQNEVPYKHMIDSEYFYTKIFHHPTFVFILDFTFEKIEQSIEAIVNVLRNEAFTAIYKKIAFVQITDRCTVLGKYKNEITEYHISENVFMSPDLFFESNDLECIIEYFERLASSDSLILNTNHAKNLNIESSLLKLANFSIGSKMALFSNRLFDLQNTSQFIEASASLSVFCTGNIISEVPTYTMGQIFHYSQNDFYKAKSDLFNICTLECAFNINIEVKTSSGISRNSVYANTLIENITNVNLSHMDSNSTVTYTFFIDEYITDPTGYIQFIISYYSYDGLYKTLILNQEFKFSKEPYEIYNNVSFDTLFCCFSKYIAENPENIKNVETMMCKFLRYYRKMCCKDVSTTQFVLPETTKLLPVLFQALTKSSVFSISPNKTFLSPRKIINYNVEQTVRFFYPRMFTLTDYYMEQDLTKIKSLKLSASVLDSSEIYVLENSIKIYLYIGKDVDPTLKDGIFNNEEEHKVLLKLLEDINACYGYELPVIVVEEGKKGNENEFYGFMVEDSLNGVCSYYDYVCELHFKVQNI